MDDSDQKRTYIGYFVPISRKAWEQEQQELIARGETPPHATYQEYVLRLKAYGWGSTE